MRIFTTVIVIMPLLAVFLLTPAVAEAATADPRTDMQDLSSSEQSALNAIQAIQAKIVEKRQQLKVFLEQLKAPSSVSTLGLSRIQEIYSQVQTIQAAMLVDVNQLSQLSSQLSTGGASSAPAVSGMSQLATQAPGVCPAISQTLSLGSTGHEVSELQDYLMNQGLLAAATVTGHFGIETQSAVQKLQSLQGIVASGAPATTGYGAVGPKTQQFFAACRSTAANSVNNPAIANEDFGWGKKENCGDNADGLLLTEDATDAQLRTCKPSTADFIASVRAAGGSIDTDTAVELLYGTTGSNGDYRNWKAILSAKDPVAAARHATGELYNSDLPYSDGTAYQNVPYEVVAQSGNLAWVEFENWKGSDGKPVQGLYVVDGNGVPLRNTSLDPIKVITTAQNFGVLDPKDLRSLAGKLDARGIDYKPGEVYAGSSAGVDLRGLAQGNLGVAAGSLNPEDCISKLPSKERGTATEQGLCVEPAMTRLDAYLDYQESLLESGDLKTSCKSITDPVQQSVYRGWYARNDAYGQSYFQAPGWVGNPASCSWLN